MSESRGRFLPFSVSQNFLTEKRLINNLINKTGLGRGDTVLEIGAGKGHITRALAERCGEVISYEIDRRLYERLLPELPGNARLLCGDFLAARLPERPYSVFANIPFSRTSEIVRKLTAGGRPPEGAWLIMEKGAAKRFCGLPRESLGSLLLKPFFETRIIYHFKREDFHPSPSVDAVLLELKKRPEPDIPAPQRDAYGGFVGRGLRYDPRALLTKKQISTALRLAGLPQIEETGVILYVQWLCLFRCGLKYGGLQ